MTLPRSVTTVALALIALAVGFVLEDSAPGGMLGDAIALGTAILARPTLGMMGTDLVRNGVELRTLAGDWAVRVSDVCDGMGLMVALAAGLIALGGTQRGWRWGLERAALGVLLILLFNFLRVIGLALALAHAPAGFSLLHDHVFPLLTVALLGVVLLPLRLFLPFALLTLPLAVIWPFANGVTAPLLVPPANLFLGLSPVEVGDIALRADGWSVGTWLAASLDPVRLYTVPLDPRHFTLAVPVVLAAVVISRSGWWLLPAVALMLLALTIAAVDAVWALAAAHAPVPLLLRDNTGIYVPTDFTPNSDARAVLSIVQNTLVHFNALVLPFLILANHRRPRG